LAFDGCGTPSSMTIYSDVGNAFSLIATTTTSTQEPSFMIDCPFCINQNLGNETTSEWYSFSLSSSITVSAGSTYLVVASYVNAVKYAASPVGIVSLPISSQSGDMTALSTYACYGAPCTLVPETGIASKPTYADVDFNPFISWW